MWGGNGSHTTGPGSQCTERGKVGVMIILRKLGSEAKAKVMKRRGWKRMGKNWGVFIGMNIEKRGH